MFLNADDVDMNKTKAYNYFTLSCKNGYLNACLNAGIMLENGVARKKMSLKLTQCFKKVASKTKNSTKKQMAAKI